MAQALPPDTAFRLPDLTVVSASAGSGKTHTLTLRYLQMLLSRRIPSTQLRHILAVTFTNNAANEMKQRIIEYLKRISMRDPKILGFVRELVPADDETLAGRAAEQLDQILDHYSDFQVSTIDSFVIAVFQSAALDLGYRPDTDVALDADTLLRSAFDEFVKDAAAQAEHRALLDSLVRLIEQTHHRGYLWDPYGHLFRQTRSIYRDLRMLTKPLVLRDASADLETVVAAVQEQARVLRTTLDGSGLAVNRHFRNDLDALAEGEIDTVLGHSIKEQFLNKPARGQQDAHARFEPIAAQGAGEVYRLLGTYARTLAHARYYPFVRFLGLLEARIASVSRREQTISLDDINRSLNETLTRGNVPEIYFKLGERIHHYLIDEFQDTSPIQWRILRPLLEETLAGEGSLFVVGDTKQSIYGFRGADWRIMNALTLGHEFDSVLPAVAPLGTNFRSTGAILAFNRRLFHEGIPASPYAEGGRMSGLSAFEQEVVKEKKDAGYVRVRIMERSEQLTAEESELTGVLTDLRGRGYGWGEIAILTPANDDVIRISAWLNDRGIPFISHSNLDIRNRRAVREVLAFVRFLDSPVDTLAFATVLLGTLFERSAPGITNDDMRRFVFESMSAARSRRPLYKLFQERYPVVWQRLFQPLFIRVGYSPLYDLVSDLLKSLDVFSRLPDEEAAMTRLLEVVRTFEREGTNSLREFIAFARDEEGAGAWTMQAPPSTGAVTIMTVHKSKGLDFPAVVVYLRDDVPAAGNPVISEEDDGVRLLYLVESLCKHAPDLAAERRRADVMQEADALNRLYVAFTRAKEEMHIICSYRKEMKGPLSVLPDGLTFGAPSRAPKRPQTAEAPPLAMLHHTMQREYPLTGVKRPGLPETRRGDRIHAILAGIGFLAEGWEERLRAEVALMRDLSGGEVDEAGMFETLRRFLAHAEIRPLFESRTGRTVTNEQEFVNARGELFRCDRIVTDGDVITVIDFKTGGRAGEEGYRRQVAQYCGLLREVYPHANVSGVIAYVDQLALVTV